MIAISSDRIRIPYMDHPRFRSENDMDSKPLGCPLDSLVGVASIPTHLTSCYRDAGSLEGVQNTRVMKNKKFCRQTLFFFNKKFCGVFK